MAAKVLISGPGRLDTMSMTLHTNNELNDAYENCVGRRVKRNRVVHLITNVDAVSRRRKGRGRKKKRLNKDPRSVGGQFERRTWNRHSGQIRAYCHPHHGPQCIAYYVMSRIKSVNGEIFLEKP